MTICRMARGFISQIPRFLPAAARLLSNDGHCGNIDLDKLVIGGCRQKWIKLDRRLSMGDAYKLYEDGRSEISIKDYQYKPRVRQYESTRGGRQIISLLESNIGEYHAALHDIAAFRDDFSCIKVTGDWTSEEPLWANDWLPGLDSMYLYTLIRKKQPRIYFEVGSGNSTKFVRKAIKDGHLSTKIVSVDPSPRAEVDNICDIVIRKRFEDIDESVYLDTLTAGDVVFIDNSHRSFQSSDVTVFLQRCSQRCLLA
jgi:hypothetical protein